MGGRRGPLRPASVAFLQKSAKPWEPLRSVLIPNLRRAMVEDRVAARAAVAPVAAANELELLKACLRAAASRGQSVGAGIFEIAPVRHEPTEGVALELAQLHEIASTMPERIKRVVPFCGTVGLRFTEAVTLTDDRVDLEAGEIIIPRDLNKGRRAKGVPLARVEVQLLREQLLARPPALASSSRTRRAASTRRVASDRSGCRRSSQPGSRTSRRTLAGGPSSVTFGSTGSGTRRSR
jgi:integrase